MARASISQAQNLVTWSEALSNWFAASGASAIDNYAIGPDGLMSASLVSSTGGGSLFAIGTSGVPFEPYGDKIWTASVYAKANGGTTFRLSINTESTLDYCSFDLSTGIASPTGSNVVNYGMQPVSGYAGWYRCWITFKMSSTGLWIFPPPSSNCLMYGVQINNGLAPSVYTKTTAAAVYDGGMVRNPQPVSQNLLKYSNDYTNAVWTNSGNEIVLSPNTSDVLDPWGGNTATKWTDTATPGARHQIYQYQALYVRGKSTFSVILKPGTNNYVRLSDNAANHFADFNLTTGECYNTNSSDGLAVMAWSEPYGLAAYGWRRFNLYCSSLRKELVNIVMSQNGNSFDYAGGTGTMYVSGSSIVLANHGGEYVQTTSAYYNYGNIRDLMFRKQNLITYSNAFASWPNLNVTVADNTQMAPDGTLTASLLTSLAGSAFIAASLTNVTLGRIYTASVYAKAGTGNIQILVNATLTVDVVNFNLTTGTMSSSAGANLIGWKISPVPGTSGWYRVAIVFRAVDTNGFRIYPNTSNTVIVTNAQVVEGNLIDPDYTATTTAKVDFGAYRNSSIRNLII